MNRVNCVGGTLASSAARGKTGEHHMMCACAHECAYSRRLRSSKYANTNTDTHANTDAVRHAYVHAHAHAHTNNDTNAHAHASIDTYAKPGVHTHTHCKVTTLGWVLL